MKEIVLILILCIAFVGWCALFYVAGRQSGKHEAYMKGYSDAIRRREK